MSRTLRAEFNIIISDGFEKAVRDFFSYSKEEELDNEDIREFLENKIIAAQSLDENIKIEGDGSGWFIQCVSE